MEGQTPVATPKVFISYSWSSPGHRELIRSYGERLISEGIQVILDEWDFVEGQDKYDFMEMMVRDDAISKVLLFSDRIYAKKANERKAGVGAETQIISKKIYDEVKQSRFIPIVCELDDSGEPCLPTFLDKRKWIDFSTAERASENWERLVRVIYGKPLHQKPELGTPPSFITDDHGYIALPTIGKFEALKRALVTSSAATKFYRDEYINSVIAFADRFRTRKPPDDSKLYEKIIDDLRQLLPLRDQIVSWISIEASLPNTDFNRLCTRFLEKVLALKYKPPEFTMAYRQAWFDTHGIFAYEIFIYVIAVLINSDRYDVVRDIFQTQYLLPEAATNSDRMMDSYSEFGMSSEVLALHNETKTQKLLSPIGDLIKNRVTLDAITFEDIIQAELIVVLVTVIKNGRWYPNTLPYAGWRSSNKYPLFMRATQHREYDPIKTITGIQTGNELRTIFIKNYDDYYSRPWQYLSFHADVSLWSALNMERIDTKE